MNRIHGSFLSLEKSIKRVQSNDFSLSLSLFLSRSTSLFFLKKKKKKKGLVRLYLFHVDWSRDRQLDSRTRSSRRGGTWRVKYGKRATWQSPRGPVSFFLFHLFFFFFFFFLSFFPSILHEKCRRKTHTPTGSRIYTVLIYSWNTFERFLDKPKQT